MIWPWDRDFKNIVVQRVKPKVWLSRNSFSFHVHKILAFATFLNHTWKRYSSQNLKRGCILLSKSTFSTPSIVVRCESRWRRTNSFFDMLLNRHSRSFFKVCCGCTSSSQLRKKNINGKRKTEILKDTCTEMTKETLSSSTDSREIIQSSHRWCEGGITSIFDFRDESGSQGGIERNAWRAICLAMKCDG